MRRIDPDFMALHPDRSVASVIIRGEFVGEFGLIIAIIVN
jgi:hypothetical protein